MIRRYLALVPVAAAAVFVIVAIYFQDRLPEPLAIHFGISGGADGFADFWPSVIFNSLLIASPALVALLFSKGLKEKGLTGVFLWLPLGLTALFFSISSYLLLIQIDLSSAEIARLDANFFLLVFAPISLLLLLLMRKPKIAIESDGLAVTSLGVSMARVPFSELKDVSIGEIKAADFGGWGIRVNFFGDVAFLPSSGKALVLARKQGNKILVRSDDAENLKKDIERNMS